MREVAKTQCDCGNTGGQYDTLDTGQPLSKTHVAVIGEHDKSVPMACGSQNSDAHGSHGRQAGHSVPVSDKFWWSFAITIPVPFGQPTFTWLDYTAPYFPGAKLYDYHRDSCLPLCGSSFPPWSMGELRS